MAVALMCSVSVVAQDKTKGCCTKPKTEAKKDCKKSDCTKKECPKTKCDKPCDGKKKAECKAKN